MTLKQLITSTLLASTTALSACGATHDCCVDWNSMYDAPQSPIKQFEFEGYKAGVYQGTFETNVEFYATHKDQTQPYHVHATIDSQHRNLTFLVVQWSKDSKTETYCGTENKYCYGNGANVAKEGRLLAAEKVAPIKSLVEKVVAQADRK